MGMDEIERKTCVRFRTKRDDKFVPFKGTGW